MLNQNAFPKVQIRGTEVQTITSKINSQAYDLYFHFPRTYRTQEIKKTYPVLYVLNGQWDIPLIIGCFGNANYDGLIPEVILVGISWNGDETDAESVALGMRDFTPHKLEGLNYGGAPAFLNVIENEIIPFVEKNYPVNEDRGLVGSSIAGFFAFYLMFNKPNLFKRYIISSPVANFANGLLFQLEESFFKADKDDQLNIFVCYGELEDTSHMEALITQIKNRHYQHLKLEEKGIYGTGHAGNKPIGYAIGIRNIYKREKINISKDDLLDWVGVYFSENRRIIIGLDDKGINLSFAPQGLKIELLAQNQYSFYADGRYLLVYFKKEFDTIKLKVETWEEIIEVQKYLSK